MEQRLADLEGQIERLTLTLVRWREAEDHRPPVERRLAQLTEQCADILKQWTATSERHAHAVGELETRLTGWNEIETRLQRDASSRFQGLERTIEREWASLRHLHEEPTRQLREQAETLTEISVHAAGSAQTGIERAEARLATLENDLHRRIDDLSREIHAVLDELRQRGAAPALRSPASAWSLDEVTRLHQELRDGASVVNEHPGDSEKGVLGTSTTSLAPRAARPMWGANTETSAATPLEPTDVSRSEAAGDDAPADRSFWKWSAAIGALAIVIGLLTAFALSFYNRANQAAERASEAQQRADRIATAANERIEAARQDANAQITRARDAASKAQVTGDVLAAPDLVRFNLTSGDSAVRASAQLLWSRSRGLVFSASRLQPPPPGATYQIWLLTAGEPVSAGIVTPDASGRATVATDSPPNVPRPIVGVSVTVVPVPGSPTPSGATVLARAQ